MEVFITEPSALDDPIPTWMVVAKFLMVFQQDRTERPIPHREKSAPNGANPSQAATSQPKMGFHIALCERPKWTLVLMRRWSFTKVNVKDHSSPLV